MKTKSGSKLNVECAIIDGSSWIEPRILPIQ